MSRASAITFHPVWKEELHATLDGHEFVMGAPMGMPYLICDLVSEAVWEHRAPPWAAGRWSLVLDALLLYAATAGSPVEVTVGEPWSWVFFGD